MKQIAPALLLIAALTACGGTGSPASTPSAVPDTDPVTESTAPAPTPTPEVAASHMTPEEFDGLLAGLPLCVTPTKYIVQDEQYKSLYPDVLQAILQNNSSADIKDAVVAFAAWDKNGLPVKIKGSIDFSDGAYVKQVNYGDINLVPGDTFGDSSGYSVDEACGIEEFKAVAVSYETFEGDSWENPYFEDWCALYEGVRLADVQGIDVVIREDAGAEPAPAPSSKPAEEPAYTAEALQAELDAQEVRITSTDYVVQDEQYKSLYPDMLQAIIQNNSSADIKDAIVAFAAWDKNGLPVKIKGSIDFSDGAYVKQVSYSDINLVPGSSFGDSSGYSVDEVCGIETFKAIVVSYETFEGDTWENPLYEAWCELYEGQRQS